MKKKLAMPVRVLSGMIGIVLGFFGVVAPADLQKKSAETTKFTASDVANMRWSFEPSAWAVERPDTKVIKKAVVAKPSKPKSQ